MVELMTQREKAYRGIKSGILNFKWRPGTKLIERELSKELGVSRTPIRESLNRLEKEGLIEHVPQWGVYIKKVDKQDIIEMYEVREALEGVAAKLAASRATQDDLDRMKQAIEEMEHALFKEGGEETKAFNDADNGFHNLLVKSSHNKKLIDLASMCHMHVEDLPRRIHKEYGKKEHMLLLEEHKKILAVIITKNGLEAEELIRQHLSNAKQNAERFFEEMGSEDE